MPLVLLDPGAIYAMYVGESEQRLRSALSTVDAMAPVVLWIDEIEKGFAGSSSDADAGTARRVIGSFLRWLQERPAGVFLIATCNDVDTLPSEFVRRGRFDEIFFVDLPDPTERSSILELHLRQRRRDPSSFDLAALVAATDGFTGAELEAVVVGGLYRAFGEANDLSTDDLLEEAHRRRRCRRPGRSRSRRCAHGPGAGRRRPPAWRCRPSRRTSGDRGTPERPGIERVLRTLLELVSKVRVWTSAEGRVRALTRVFTRPPHVLGFTEFGPRPTMFRGAAKAFLYARPRAGRS